MPKIVCNQAKRWCFTLNNYSDVEVTIIRTQLQLSANFAVIGKEVGDNGTPHLQGYCSLKQKVRLTGLKKILGPRVHAEVARGTDQQNLVYCTKSDTEAWQWGTPRAGTSEHGGGATDHVAALQCIQARIGGASTSEILDSEELFPAYLRHKKVIDELVVAAQQDKALTEARSELTESVLRRWQCKLKSDIELPADKRSIIWYSDVRGNTGKTWMSKYLMALHGALRLENGKSSDLKHAYNGQRIVIFDLSRTQQEHLNYEAIESIKNGMVFSPKYQSVSKVFTIPHVICFANWDPNYGAMSADRWDVRNTDDSEVCSCSGCSKSIVSESQDCQASWATTQDILSEPDILDFAVATEPVLDAPTALLNLINGDTINMNDDMWDMFCTDNMHAV